MGTARPRTNQNPTKQKGQPMTTTWEQPIRPMEVYPHALEVWRPVLFIRATSKGWEAMSISGAIWSSEHASIREVPK